MTVSEDAPHPPPAGREAHPPVRVVDQRRLQHPNFFVRLNAKLGLRITLVVGTMWCAYLFTLLALVSAPSAFRSGDPIIIVAWVAQTFLQLVLLPVIIVGQNVQAAAADKRSEATFKDAVAILQEARQIQRHLRNQDDRIEQIVAAQSALPSGAGPAAGPA